ncbi:TPA: hypothetical protein ACH3X2_009173 [Trebouxia sp. C0005]
MFKNHIRPVHTKTRCNFVTLPALAEVSQRCKAVPPVSPVLAAGQRCRRDNNQAHKTDNGLLRHCQQPCSSLAASRQRIFRVAGSGLTPLCAPTAAAVIFFYANSSELCKSRVICCSEHLSISALGSGSWAPGMTESSMLSPLRQHAARWPCHRLVPQAIQPAVRCTSLLSRYTLTRRTGRLTTSASLHTYTESPAGRVYKTTIMAKTVGEVRKELQRRNIDDRGTKKILVERLYTIIQQEADQLKVSQKAAAATPEPPLKPEPRTPRTRAEMGAKLQLRSTATPAKRANRASKSKRAAAGASPATSLGPQTLPGASAAQVVRRALLNRIALAAKQSAQQKQQQQAISQSESVQAQQQAPSSLPAQQQQQQQHSQADTPLDASAGMSQQSAMSRPQDKALETAAFQLAQQDTAEALPQFKFGAQQAKRQQPGAAGPVPESNHFASGLSTSHPQAGASGVASMQSRTSKSQNEPAASSAEEAQQQQSATPDEFSPDAIAHLDPTPPNLSLGSVPSTSNPPQDSLETGRNAKLPSDRAASSPASTDADPAAAERLGSHAQASTSSSQTSNLGSIKVNEKSGTAGASMSSYNSSNVWRGDEEEQEVVNSNASGMQISFLGTAGSLTTRTRSPSCIAVRAQKAVMLFDCGEDAQRQLIKQPQIVHGRVNRIFVTSNSSENIYGIPGMLCTLNWARERGFESADIPLHVYGPPGLADYIRTMLLLSDTYSMVPILVHEFATAACDPEPQPILTRARLYRVLVPPDQLNPNGYYDGNLDEAFLTRFDRKKKTGRADLRASAKRIKLPSPGDPARQDVAVDQMCWTIRCDSETVVTVFPLQKPQGRCLGYALQEADRAGSLDVVKVQELGVFPGPEYAALKAGEPVQNIGMSLPFASVSHCDV